MKTMMAALGFVLLASVSQAQTQTRTLEWDQPNATPVEAAAFTWTVKVDSGSAAPSIATCATVATATHCTTPIGALTPNASHTVTLTATNAMGSASSSITGKPPDVSVNLKIVVVTTVP